MKILLIDDDPLVGEAIIMTMKAHHHVVDLVEDGQYRARYGGDGELLM